MDWTEGYSARYYLSILDKKTMRDIRRVELKSGTIKRTMSDLRESADLNCGQDYNSSKEEYIRVWLDTKQNGVSSHTPLFTGIATSPEKEYEGIYSTSDIACYSILKIAQDILLEPGWYVPVDMDGAKMVKKLLSVTGAPIFVADDSPVLSQAIIAEYNENNLSMAEKILDAINWRLKIDGYGNIRIEPYSTESIGLFGATSNDILETRISIQYDWFNCPNVFRAVMDDEYSVARDDDPDSPLSTVSRGREIWLEESSCNLNQNETLEDYARRRLKELQQVSTAISYDRRFIPDIYPSDVITLNYPKQGAVGNFLITEQSISLGHSAKTAEEVIRV